MPLDETFRGAHRDTAIIDDISNDPDHPGDSTSARFTRLWQLLNRGRGERQYALSATSRMRSRVALRGVVSSITNCTGDFQLRSAFRRCAAAIGRSHRQFVDFFRQLGIFHDSTTSSPSPVTNGEYGPAISITENWDDRCQRYRDNLPQFGGGLFLPNKPARDNADLQGWDRAQPVRLVRIAEDRARPQPTARIFPPARADRRRYGRGLPTRKRDLAQQCRLGRQTRLHAGAARSRSTALQSAYKPGALELETTDSPMPISGNIGPLGDGYVAMTTTPSGCTRRRFRHLRKRKPTWSAPSP